VVEKASRRAWRTFGLAPEDGSAAASVHDMCILIEEFAYGNLGYSVIIDQTLKVQRIVARLASGKRASSSSAAWAFLWEPALHPRDLLH